MKTPYSFMEYFRVILYSAAPVCVFILLSGRPALSETIQIDSAWLEAHSPSPYHLTGQGSTYVLQTDVTTGGTAFLFDDDQIIFDLNGHTITYANLDFAGVLNPGFETGVPGNPNRPLNWDLSSAPHGRRQDSLARLYFDDYSLRIENPSGDALTEESALSSPVNLPAPGRYAAFAQVHGSPYPEVRVHLAVEGISTMLDNKISNMPLVYQNTDMSIGIIGEFDIAAPTTVRVRVVLGTADPSVATTADIDEVDIRPIGMNGISQKGKNKKLLEIKNGTIKEGRSQAVYSHALHHTSCPKIHDLAIITNGINSENLSEVWAGGLQIYGNRLEAHGKLPLHRHFPFAMIDLGRTTGGNEIFDNTLLYGPHVGILHGNASASADNSNRSRIYQNTIQTRIVATNGFALWLGSNADVYSNMIQPIQGHGIGLLAGSNNVRIYDNIIEPKSWPCSEYASSTYPNSAHGIRLKTYGNGNFHNVEIFSNRIVGKILPQKTNCYTELSGISNYVTDNDPTVEPNPARISIHDNTVQVETDYSLQQHAIAYKVGSYGDVYQNSFSSNHIIVEMSGVDAGVGQNSILRSNTLIKGVNPSAFHAISFGYNRPYGNVLLDTKLGLGVDLKDILQTRKYLPATDLAVSWYLRLMIRNARNRPIPGAFVQIRDRSGTLVKEGPASAGGEYHAALREYTYTFDSQARFDYASPYTVTVSAPRYQAMLKSINLTSSQDSIFILGTRPKGLAAPRDSNTLP